MYQTINIPDQPPAAQPAKKAGIYLISIKKMSNLVWHIPPLPFSVFFNTGV